jgi:hypothetical protein
MQDQERDNYCRNVIGLVYYSTLMTSLNRGLQTGVPMVTDKLA